MPLQRVHSTQPTGKKLEALGLVTVEVRAQGPMKTFGESSLERAASALLAEAELEFEGADIAIYGVNFVAVDGKLFAYGTAYQSKSTSDDN